MMSLFACTLPPLISLLLLILGTPLPSTPVTSFLNGPLLDLYTGFMIQSWPWIWLDKSVPVTITHSLLRTSGENNILLFRFTAICIITKEKKCCICVCCNSSSVFTLNKNENENKNEKVELKQHGSLQCSWKRD